MITCLQMRPLLSSLYRAASHGSHSSRVGSEARNELRAWEAVLRAQTHTATPFSWFFQDPQRAFDSIWCGDASGSEGFGSWCRHGGPDHLFHVPWPKGWIQGDDQVSSALHELVPLTVIVLKYLRQGHEIAYETDSAAMVAAFRKGRSPKPKIHHLLQLIMTRAAQTRSDVRVT